MDKSVRYQRTIDSSETDPVLYNYVVENEYSVIKHSGKVALQRVPRSKCVSVQFSQYKTLKVIHYKVKKLVNFSRNLLFQCLWHFDSVMLLQSQLPHGGSVATLLLGADFSPVLPCHHNSHGCTVLSNILSIC